MRTVSTLPASNEEALLLRDAIKKQRELNCNRTLIFFELPQCCRLQGKDNEGVPCITKLNQKNKVYNRTGTSRCRHITKFSHVCGRRFYAQTILGAISVDCLNKRTPLPAPQYSWKSGSSRKTTVSYKVRMTAGVGGWGQKRAYIQYLPRDKWEYKVVGKPEDFPVLLLLAICQLTLRSRPTNCGGTIAIVGGR